MINHIIEELRNRYGLELEDAGGYKEFEDINTWREVEAKLLHLENKWGWVRIRKARPFTQNPITTEETFNEYYDRMIKGIYEKAKELRGKHHS